MAYTPRTWNNEVITDAKLNALENGLAAASTLTGTDIDADKDWGGRTLRTLGLCPRIHSFYPNPRLQSPPTPPRTPNIS